MVILSEAKDLIFYCELRTVNCKLIQLLFIRRCVMKILCGITILFLAFLVGCNCPNEAGTDCEKKIPLSEVPEPALNAAQAAVPGITLSEAEIEVEDGKTTYDLEGDADGKEYKIEVTPDGKVLEAEEENENKDEDNDKDDDKDNDK